MIDTKFTKERFKNHFYYAKWMYVAFIALGFLMFSLIFSVTKPKVPKEFKIDITVLNFTVQDTEKDIWQEEILAILPEDQQEVNIYSLGFGGEETMGGYSIYDILGARMAAKEDDIYIMPKDVYLNFAEIGAFKVMDDFIMNYEYPEDFDLEQYKVTAAEDTGADGKPHFYGIPLDNVMGLVDLGVDPRESVVGILVYTENYENAVKTVDYIMNKTESAVLNSAQQEAEAADGQ